MVHLPAWRHEVDQGQSEVPCGNPGVLDGSGDWGYEEHGCGGEVVIWADSFYMPPTPRDVKEARKASKSSSGKASSKA